MCTHRGCVPEMALVLPGGYGSVDHLGGLVVIAPAHRAGDPGLDPGPGENFL